MNTMAESGIYVGENYQMTNKPKFILFAGKTLREGKAVFQAEETEIAELAETENIDEDEAVRRFFEGRKETYRWAIPHKIPQISPDALRESLDWEDGDIDDYKFSADVLNRIDLLNRLLAEEIPRKWKEGPEIEASRIVHLFHDWTALYNKKRMKISLSAKTLLDTLAFVAPAAKNRIEQHVSLEATKTIDGGTIRVAAGKADILYVEQTVAATVFVPGTLFVPLQPTVKFLETLDADSDATIEKTGDGEITISQGTKSVMLLTCSSDKAFQFDGELSPVARIALSDLKTVADRVCMSTNAENSHYALGGVLLSTKSNQSAFVATCGKRLHVQRIAAQELASDAGSEASESIVSRHGLEVAATIPSEVSDMEVLIEKSSGYISFSTVHYRVVSKLIDGRFPRWERIIPTPVREEPDGIFEVGSLHKHFKSAAITADDKSPGLTLTLSNGNLAIESNRTELGQSRVAMPVNYVGEQRKACLDGNFLLSMLAALPKESRIAIRFGEDDPFTFESADGFTAVIMLIK